MQPSSPLMRRREAAAYLQAHYGIGAYRTLSKLAVIGGGPRYRLAGRVPLYSAEDLDAWMSSRLSAPRASTSDIAGAN